MFLFISQPRVGVAKQVSSAYRKWNYISPAGSYISEENETS